MPRQQADVGEVDVPCYVDVQRLDLKFGGDF